MSTLPQAEAAGPAAPEVSVFSDRNAGFEPKIAAGGSGALQGWMTW